MSKYMVSVVGKQAPSRIHVDLESAKTEAERLSKQAQNRDCTIYVVEIKATLKPVKTHIWEQ